MRVLLINDYGGPFAGAEVLTLAMRDGLRARGHEARLLASTAPLLPGENAEVDLLPFHNSAYKREWLDGYGARLGAMLDAEYWLQADIRSRGGRLYLEPAARTAHANEPLLATSLRLLFGQGRAFGSHRSGAWSRLRRAGYVLGAPAIPLMNLPRALRDAGRSMEAAAYLTGSGGDEEFLVAHEFSHRPETKARS